MQRIFLYGIALVAAGVAPSRVAMSQEFSTPARVLHVTDADLDMNGPETEHLFHLGDGAKSELFWITGFAVLTDAGQQKRDDLLCHSFLLLGDGIDANSRARNAKAFKGTFKKVTLFTPKLFTLSAGENQIRFPEGFGLPIRPGQTLSTLTMAKGPAKYLKQSKSDVSISEKIEYVDDKDLKAPMQPLVKIAFETTVDAGEAEAKGGQGNHGPAWASASAIKAHGKQAKNAKGGPVLTFWMIPPGLHTYRSDAPHFPFDSTIHFISVHVHPFAKSMELFDKTAGATVFKSDVETGPHGNLLKVPQFSSQEGVKIYKAHDYELIASYDNTSAEEVDAMAKLQIYFLDTKFQR